jgi:hypothetical protein
VLRFVAAREGGAAGGGVAPGGAEVPLVSSGGGLGEDIEAEWSVWDGTAGCWSGIRDCLVVEDGYHGWLRSRTTRNDERRRRRRRREVGKERGKREREEGQYCFSAPSIFFSRFGDLTLDLIELTLLSTKVSTQAKVVV